MSTEGQKLFKELFDYLDSEIDKQLAADPHVITFLDAVVITLRSGARHVVMMEPDVLRTLLREWRGALAGDVGDKLRSYPCEPSRYCTGRLVLDITTVESVLVPEHRRLPHRAAKPLQNADTLEGLD